MHYLTLPPLTVIDIVGTDAARVLNNLCTAPVLQLTSGEGHEGFITDVRGRTLGHVCLYRHQDRLRLVGSAGQAEAIASHLDRYTIREDAAAQDRSDDYSGLLITEQTLHQAGGSCKVVPPTTPQTLPWCTVADPHGGGMWNEVTVNRVPWTADGRTLVIGPHDAVDGLKSKLAEFGFEAADESAFHRARVVNRFPWYGIDLDDRNLPQEADRDALAISFTKGCYLGQETVARLDALGQVQKKLVLWRIESPQPPAAGSELTDDSRVVGRLTSVVIDPAGGGFLALGFARRSHFDTGSTARWTSQDDQSFVAVVI